MLTYIPKIESDQISDELLEELTQFFKLFPKELAWVPKFKIKSSHILFARVDDKIAAACLFNRRKKDDMYIIYDIAVHPEFRGRRLGQTIVEYLFARGNIMLKCKDDNDACNWYQAQGFRLISKEPSKKSTLCVFGRFRDQELSFEEEPL